MSYNWEPEHNITELNRTTVSDGSTLNSGTFNVLGTRDDYLLSSVNNENTDFDTIYSFLSSNSAKMDNINLSSFSAVNVYGDKLIGDSGLSGELHFSANCLSFDKLDDEIHINLTETIENNISSYYNIASATSSTYSEPSAIKNSVAFRTNCSAGNNSLVFGTNISATDNSVAMVREDINGDSYSINNSFILGTDVNYFAKDNSIGLFSNCTAVNYSIAIKGASATDYSIAYGQDPRNDTTTIAMNRSISIFAYNGEASNSSFCFLNNASAFNKSFSFDNSYAQTSSYAFYHAHGSNESIAYYFSSASYSSISVQNSTASASALAFAGSSAINGIAYDHSSANNLGIAYSNSEAHSESIALYNSKATSSSRGIAIRESNITDGFNIAINKSAAETSSIGISYSRATDNSLAISNTQSSPYNIGSHNQSIALLDSSTATNHSVAIINSTGTNYSLSFLNALSTGHSVAFNSSTAYAHSVSDTRSFAATSSYASIESSATYNSLSLYNSYATNSSVALWNSSAISDVKLDKNRTSYPLYNISLWDNSLRINSDGFINDILIKIANGLLNDPILSATYLIG